MARKIFTKRFAEAYHIHWNERICCLEDQITELLEDDEYDDNVIDMQDKMLFLKARSYWTELADMWNENGMMTEDKKNSILKALNDRNTGQSVPIC